MADTQQQSETVFVVAPPALEFQRLAAVDPHTIKLLLFAQYNYPYAYAAFVKELRDNHIPWSFEDAGFLERLNRFRATVEALIKNDGTTEAQLTAAVPKEVLDPLVLELEAHTAQEKAEHESFIHELVDRYVASLKNEGVELSAEEQKALQQKVADEYGQLRARGIDPHDTTGEVQHVLDAGLSVKKLSPEESLHAAGATKAVATEVAPQLVRVAATAAVVRETFSSPVEKKDVFAKIYFHVSGEKPAAPATTCAEEAQVLTQRMQAFSAGIAKEEGSTAAPDITGQGVFFRAFADSAPRKAAAAVADRVLLVLPQKTREQITTTVLARSWERVVENLTQKLGGAAVGAPIFRQAIEAGNKAFGGRPAGGLKTIRNVFLDAGGTVFGSPDAAMVGFFDLVRINASLPQGRKLFVGAFPMPVVLRPAPSPPAAPSPPTAGPPLRPPAGRPAWVSRRVMVQSFVLQWQQFYVATVLPYVQSHPRLAQTFRLDFLSDIGGWVMRLGAKKAAKKAGKEVADTAARAAAAEGAKKGIAALLTKLGLSALVGALTGGTSLLLQGALWVGGKILGLAWAGLKALITVPTGLLTRLMTGAGPSPRWQDDLGLVFSAGLVGVIILLFLFPSFLNFPQVHEAARMSALVAPIGGEGPGGPIRPGAPVGPPVAWAYSGPAPTSTVTRCPVAGGTITQGPNGSFSHARTNAYDIANAIGSAIYATHNAYVVRYRDNLDPYVFENRSYGNYVLLVARDTSTGSYFFTMYAHLLTVSPIVSAAFSATRSGADPRLIRAGEQIGTMDATGSTYGNGPGGTGIHLHYEYRGPNSASFLVAGCP